MRSILCYGDSNTYGLMPGLVGRYPREVRWTGILQKLLGESYYIIEEGLGGRTTVWDDPIEEYKNGKKYLIPCLESHQPLDLVVIMLGTNDLKKRFSVSAFDIGAAMENLVKTILKSESGIDYNPPKVLLVTPVPIKSVGDGDLDQMLEDGEEKSRALGGYFQKVAEKYQTSYLDPGDSVETGTQDGIHFTVDGHRKMAELLAEKIDEIFSPSVVC